MGAAATMQHVILAKISANAELPTYGVSCMSLNERPYATPTNG
jgi:hypothetical protein